MVFRFLKSGYDNVIKAFSKAGARLGAALRNLLGGDIDENTLESLEKLLYEADLGISTVDELIDKVKKAYYQNPKLGAEGLIDVIKQELKLQLSNKEREIKRNSSGPTIILVVGVNGNGKTTTIARLAHRFKQEKLKVLVGAGDTFRAAAIDQLQTWADKVQVEIVRGKIGGDPAAIAYDTVSAATARAVDVALIDTAGRLHNKDHLMKELEKIKRSCAKALAGAPHETLLILDATTGQNAIDQAKKFNEVTPITGLVLTKLDGTAKGGIVVNIEKQLQIPVKFIGVGETQNDLQPFDPQEFISALLDG